jgi:hypothetical protein
MHNLHKAIGDCLARGQHFAALILLYAGIDIIASIELKKGNNKTSFTSWADAYLIPAGSLDCTSLELYSARCGILHTMTAESDLSRSGQARAIYYSWGDADPRQLNAAIEMSEAKGTALVLNVEHLSDSFMAAVINWSKEVRLDAVRLQRIEAKAVKWFVNMQTDFAWAYVDENDEGKN